MALSRRSLLRSAAALSAATLASPALLGRAFADDSILVGSLHDLSGALAATGSPMVESLHLAVEEVNAAGGLLGRPLRLVGYDCQTNIQLYSQYAQQLAVRDKVSVVFGGITSASREAIRPTFSRFRTPYFYSTLYEGGVCDRNTFSIGTTPAQTVERLVPYAMGESGKRVYIIAADYNYGQITAKWMQKYARDHGGEAIGVDFFPLDVTNFGPTISKIQAAKPDLILSALVGGNHVSFYRQWASAGMKAEIPIASTTFGLFNEPATLDAAESEGIIGAYGYFEELETPANAAYVSSLRKLAPSIPYIGEPAAATYEAVHLWAEGVKQAGSVERAKLVDALEGGLSFDGPSGKVTVDHATHHVTRNAYLARVKDRKWNVFQTDADAKPSDTAAVCNLIQNPTDNKQYEISL